MEAIICHLLPTIPAEKNHPRTSTLDSSTASNGSRRRTPRRSAPSFVSASTADNGMYLKPRPKPKPIRPATVPEDPLGDAPTIKQVPPAVCTQIEKLVLFKRYAQALELFDFLRSKSGGACALPPGTYDSLVSACIGLGSVRDVKAVFCHMIETGFEFDLYMRNRVLLMHVKCGMMADARLLFDGMPERNAVSWNTIMSGLVDSGCCEEALDMFLIMWAEGSEDAGSRTFAVAIRATASITVASTGRQLHACALKLELGEDIFVTCALIDMYCKCGCTDEAKWAFEDMPEKTVVGWNTLIAGYALNGYSEEALGLYGLMRESGVQMDHFTYSIIFRICARLASLEHAKQAHASLVRNGFGSDLVANTALVDLYCKWGRMEDARHIFDKMPRKNVISWNALIGGYGNHGRGKEALKMFDEMLKQGMVPNHITFLAVLGACSYSGMSEKGWELFETMTEDFNIKPRAMHYACMVELLGREGQLDEALALIKEAPFDPTANMWGALLTACRFHKNVELGKLAAEKLCSMESSKISNYIVLLNLYTSSGRLEEVARVLDTMRKKGFELSPACSWIEVDKRPHGFYFQDRSHPHTDQIYEKLDKLMREIAKHGYRPRGKSLLPDVGEHEERMTHHHSEKLAVSFGLINTPESTPLQVVQNHRMCSDCHNAVKLISLVTGRDIVVRDSSRFHYFKSGVCSCGDYW